LHILPGPGTTGTARWDQHFLLDPCAVGGHEADAAFLVIAANQNFMGTLYHLNDGALAAPAAIHAGNPAQNPVTVEYHTHLCGAEEQVFATIIRHQDAEAITLALRPAADKIQLVHRRIGAPAGIDELAITLHGAQTATQGFDAVLVRLPELLLQL